MNDAERAKDGLEEARRIALRERLLFGFIETSFHLARIFQMQGKLREAFEVCARTKAELEKLQGQDGPPLPGLGSLEIAAGCVLFEMNEISRAEEQLSRGLDMVGWGMNPYYFFIGNYCLYLLNQSLGQAEKAGLCLINLETAWPDISFLTRGLRIHADLIEHQGKEQSIERAAEWCRLFLAETGKLEKMPGFGPFAACEVYYQGALTWMRIQTLIGNGSQVYLLANEYLRCAQTGGLLDRQVELEMILLGLESKKESEEDMQRRNRTLTLAIEKGYFQKFILADISVEAIRKAAGAAIPRPTAEQLISICSTRKTVRMDQVSEEQPAVLLSSREKEIIRLLEKGETNQQIASVLFITVGTVKSHINHILTKLDAANRTQAVAKARALGFVEKDG